MCSCVCVCVPVCVCMSLLSPPDPTHTVGLDSRIPPTPPHDPSPRSRIRARKQLRDLPLGRTTLETRTACYRGPKPQHCPKWLGEGAKGVLTSRRDGLPRVSCTSATLVCTSATLSCTSATGFWAHVQENTFCTLSYPLWALLRVRTPVAGSPGLKTTL